jgi:quinolinate synthase
MSDAASHVEAIRAIKRTLGQDLLILGHYYQNADNLVVADVVGDSYQLSVTASRSTARAIVFCGVHFMAESARILCRPEQRVYLPHHGAGCPMANMVNPAGFRAAMAGLAEAWGTAPVPVLYVNSTAEVKALAGQAGGVCCTSSNAALIVRRILGEGRRVFFVPDENLGRNTAAEIGVAVSSWPPEGDGGSLPDARIAVWRGYCPIHERMLAGDVRWARERYPGCRVVVHPECTPEVVGLSDGTGSTSQLLKEAEKAPAGSTLVIGTESTFVAWIASRFPAITVVPLRESRCPNMAKITTERLRSTLESIAAASRGSEAPPEEIRVPEEVRAGALAALERMISYTESAR